MNDGVIGTLVHTDETTMLRPLMWMSIRLLKGGGESEESEETMTSSDVETCESTTEEFLASVEEKLNEKDDAHEKETRREETPTHSSLPGRSPRRPGSRPSPPCSPAGCPPGPPEPGEGFWSPESDGTDARTACAALLRSSAVSTGRGGAGGGRGLSTGSDLHRSTLELQSAPRCERRPLLLVLETLTDTEGTSQRHRAESREKPQQVGYGRVAKEMRHGKKRHSASDGVDSLARVTLRTSSVR
ncbi:hypothetical protein EYF80_003711 [Liparis tanakae]|uniref:Uncharacterized protein n=1 Tax=Liparis tanakae TaxID=230148 RepID=A0A4Z2J763_9TELE|nr:hypothetical protein EYF80_003711 [Liparis tanakae]